MDNLHDLSSRQARNELTHHGVEWQRSSCRGLDGFRKEGAGEKSCLAQLEVETAAPNVAGEEKHGDVSALKSSPDAISAEAERRSRKDESYGYRSFYTSELNQL